MAALLVNGFELNSVTNGMEMFLVGVAPSISTSTTKESPYSLLVNTASSGYARSEFLHAASTNNIYIKFDCYFSALAIDAGASNQAPFAVVLDATGNRLFKLSIDEDEKVQAYASFASGEGEIGTATTVSTGQWYSFRIELRYNTTTGTKVDAYIDDTKFVDDVVTGVAGGTANQNAAIHLAYGLVGGLGVTTFTTYFDNLIVKDSTGSYNNSLPHKNERVAHYLPAAGGQAPSTDKRWQQGLGGTSSGDATNYTWVDENPPDDGAGNDFLRRNATNGANDWLDFFKGTFNSGTSPISATSTVTSISLGARVGSNSDTADPSRTMRAVFQCDDNDFSETSEPGNGAWSNEILCDSNYSTKYITNSDWDDSEDGEPGKNPIFMDVRPDTGVAFSASDLTTYQFGMWADGNSGTQIRYCAMWMAVTWYDADPDTGRPHFLGLLGVGT